MGSERMGSVTIGELLMQPNAFGDTFVNSVLRSLNKPGGRPKQKSALRKWIFRQKIRFDRVRLSLDNFAVYFSVSDMNSLSEGVIDAKVFTERGFNPKICHYSCNQSVRTACTEPNLRIGKQ